MKLSIATTGKNQAGIKKGAYGRLSRPRYHYYFFGSYLLQYLSLDGWSLYAGFSNATNRGPCIKLAVVNHRLFKLATEFCFNFVQDKFYIGLTNSRGQALLSAQ